MPTAQPVLSKLDQIEAEMRSAGLWQAVPLQPEQYDFRAAFAQDTMAFSQWLQFIFIPNVRSAAERGAFPAESHVVAQAVREFDGQPEASALLSLLADFDSLF